MSSVENKRIEENENHFPVLSSLVHSHDWEGHYPIPDSWTWLIILSGYLLVLGHDSVGLEKSGSDQCRYHSRFFAPLLGEISPELTEFL